MILDERLEFADALSVAAAAGTTLLGDVVDLKSPTIATNTTVDISGSGLFLVIQTDTEVITAGVAGTISFALVSDAQAAIAVDGTATEHIVSSALVTGSAAANDSRLNAGGYVFVGPLPPGSYERYLGVICTVGTTAVTAGKVNAFLTADPAMYRPYADNVA